MKKHLVLVGLFVVLLVAACSGGAGQGQSDPDIAVVQSFYAAIKDKQLDTAMSHVAEDAEFINPTGTYIGKEQVRGNISSLITDGIYFDLHDFKNNNGRVNYAYTVYQGDQALDEGTDGLTIVEDGMIVFDGTETTEPGS